MSKQRYNQIMDEVYEKYKTHIQQQRDNQTNLRYQNEKIESYE